MSEHYELYEKVDYGSVINLHLSRVMYVRGKLFTDMGGSLLKDRTLHNVEVYIDHVEALYTVLLPPLRGESRKYLDIANSYLRYYMMLEGAKENKEEGGNEDKLKEEMKRLVDELPEDVRDRISNCWFLYKRIALIVDKALEEMITKLNEAGLLLRGKVVKVGRVTK